MDLLKENELKEMSLIYADFTGTYNKEIKPLEYLQDNNDKIRTGTVLGFTWSNKSKIMIQFILFQKQYKLIFFQSFKKKIKPYGKYK